MNTLHSLVLLCALTIIVGCTSKQKYNIVYTNDSVVEWKELKLKECNEQSVLITLTSFEMRQAQGGLMTREQVNELQKWLMDSCVRFYKLDI